MAQESKKQWYIVQTYSGYENKVKIVLEERIRQEGVEDLFEEIFIPEEKIVEMRNGKKRERTRKFYNGYIFVKMELTDQAWHVVNDTPKVLGFIGGAQQEPTPVPESQVKKITDKIEEGSLKASATYQYQKGDKVRVAEGNFKDFTGTIEEVNEEKEKLRVFVEIFGRPTSVEFDYNQVILAEAE